MAGHIYKLQDFVGSSPDGQDDAIRKAIAHASQTIENMRWFEVIETRGQIDAGQVAHWQVTIRVGYTASN